MMEVEECITPKEMKLDNDIKSKTNGFIRTTDSTSPINKDDEDENMEKLYFSDNDDVVSENSPSNVKTDRRNNAENCDKVETKAQKSTVNENSKSSNVKSDDSNTDSKITEKSLEVDISEGSKNLNESSEDDDFADAEDFFMNTDVNEDGKKGADLNLKDVDIEEISTEPSHILSESNNSQNDITDSKEIASKPESTSGDHQENRSASTVCHEKTDNESDQELASVDINLGEIKEEDLLKSTEIDGVNEKIIKDSMEKPPSEVKLENDQSKTEPILSVDDLSDISEHEEVYFEKKTVNKEVKDENDVLEMEIKKDLLNGVDKTGENLKESSTDPRKSPMREDSDENKIDTNDSKNQEDKSSNNLLEPIEDDPLLCKLIEAIGEEDKEDMPLNQKCIDETKQQIIEDDIINLDSPIEQQIEDSFGTSNAKKSDISEVIKNIEKIDEEDILNDDILLLDSDENGVVSKIDSPIAKQNDGVTEKQIIETDDDDDVVLIDTFTQEKVTGKDYENDNLSKVSADDDVVIIEEKEDQETKTEENKGVNNSNLVEEDIQGKNNVGEVLSVSPLINAVTNDAQKEAAQKEKLQDNMDIEDDDDDCVVLIEPDETSSIIGLKSSADNKENEVIKENEDLKMGQENMENALIASPKCTSEELEDKDNKTKESDNKCPSGKDENLVSTKEETEAVEKEDASNCISLENSTKDAVTVEFPKTTEKEELPVELSNKSLKDGGDIFDKLPQILSDNSDNAQDGCNNLNHEKTEESDNLLQETYSPQNTHSHDSCSNSKNSKTRRNTIDNENSIEQCAPKRLKIDEDLKNEEVALLSDLKKESDCSQLNSDINISSKPLCLKRAITPESSISAVDSKKPKISHQNKMSDSSEDNGLKTNLLQPAPKPAAKNVNINLDFLRRFKKSITKMTKADLEELVLQKVVEAIVFKSDFSEMREMIEKQEKVISTYRNKISEITKQFRDLEMVHNRVLKDLETRNQQFIMPVKITRAVGLQVLSPKRGAEQSVGKSSSPAQQSPPSLLFTLGTPNPQQKSPAISTVPCTSSNAVVQKISLQQLQQIQQPPTVKKKSSSKITPLRPDPNNALHRNVSPPINAVGISAQSKSTVKTARNSPNTILKEFPGKSNTTSQQSLTAPSTTHYIIQPPMTQVSSSISLQPAPRGNSNTVRGQLNQQRLSTVQTSPERPKVPPMILKKSGPNNCVVSLPNGNMIASTSLAQQQGAGLTASGIQELSYAISQAFSNTATATGKSVIDLTDEDEINANKSSTQQTLNASQPALPALVAIPPQSTTTRVAYVVNKQTGAQRKITLPQGSSGVTVQRTQNSKTTSQYVPIAPKGGATLPASTSTTIFRRQPPPLPKPPPSLNMTNPSWRLSPPKPTIRINNADSGIVISWTMETWNEQYSDISSYQIFAYQEPSNPSQTEAWRHVGDVKAMLLPMAVTLTKFQEGQRYYFSVRAVDIHNRCGPFSAPKTWT